MHDLAPRPASSTCCPEPVCAVGLRVFTSSELEVMQACVERELLRHFGDFGGDGAASNLSSADADGSGAIEGSEVVHAMEAVVPPTLLGVESARRVLLHSSRGARDGSHTQI